MIETQPKRPAIKTAKRFDARQYHPFIEGERLYLREVRLEDVTDTYYDWLNDPQVCQYLETRFYPQSKKAIENYVSRFLEDPSSVFLAIILKNDARHIGNIKIGPINWIHRFADIALVLGDKPSWGNGYGTEAIRALVRYAFDILNLHRLQATIYANNHASLRAFTKAGFQEEGILRKKRFHAGKYVDEKVFSILNEVKP
jgi:RimJ/RimL family protein N-acetyltransferase